MIRRRVRLAAVSAVAAVALGLVDAGTATAQSSATRELAPQIAALQTFLREADDRADRLLEKAERALNDCMNVEALAAETKAAGDDFESTLGELKQGLPTAVVPVDYLYKVFGKFARAQGYLVAAKRECARRGREQIEAFISIGGVVANIPQRGFLARELLNSGNFELNQVQPENTATGVGGEIGMRFEGALDGLAERLAPNATTALEVRFAIQDLQIGYSGDSFSPGPATVSAFLARMEARQAPSWGSRRTTSQTLPTISR